MALYGIFHGVFRKVEGFAIAVVLAVGMGCAVGSCGQDDGSGVAEVFVPAPPDYSDDGMWVQSLNDGDGSGADVFYIPSTWEYDWTTSDGRVSHHADPSNPQHRADMATEMLGVLICIYRNMTAGICQFNARYSARAFSAAERPMTEMNCHNGSSTCI